MGGRAHWPYDLDSGVGNHGLIEHFNHCILFTSRGSNHSPGGPILSQPFKKTGNDIDLIIVKPVRDIVLQFLD